MENNKIGDEESNEAKAYATKLIQSRKEKIRNKFKIKTIAQVSQNLEK